MRFLIFTFLVILSCIQAAPTQSNPCDALHKHKLMYIQRGKNGLAHVMPLTDPFSLGFDRFAENQLSLTLVRYQRRSFLNAFRRQDKLSVGLYYNDTEALVVLKSRRAARVRRMDEMDHHQYGVYKLVAKQIPKYLAEYGLECKNIHRGSLMVYRIVMDVPRFRTGLGQIRIEDARGRMWPFSRRVTKFNSRTFEIQGWPKAGSEASTSASFPGGTSEQSSGSSQGQEINTDQQPLSKKAYVPISERLISYSYGAGFYPERENLEPKPQSYEFSSHLKNPSIYDASSENHVKETGKNGAELPKDERHHLPKSALSTEPILDKEVKAKSEDRVPFSERLISFTHGAGFYPEREDLEPKPQPYEFSSHLKNPSIYDASSEDHVKETGKNGAELPKDERHHLPKSALSTEPILDKEVKAKSEDRVPFSERLISFTHGAGFYPERNEVEAQPQPHEFSMYLKDPAAVAASHEIEASEANADREEGDSKDGEFDEDDDDDGQDGNQLPEDPKDALVTPSNKQSNDGWNPLWKDPVPFGKRLVAYAHGAGMFPERSPTESQPKRYDFSMHLKSSSNAQA